VLVEEGADGGELAVAPDERGGRRGQVAARWAAERGIVHEHLVGQVGEGRAGVDAELVGERPGDAAVGGQRVGASACPVERHDQQRPQALAQRVFGDERLELPDQLARRPEREPRGQLVLDHAQPHLGEPHAVRRHPLAVVRGGEHLGVEELQPRAAGGGRGGGVAVGEQGRTFRGQARCVQRVDGVGHQGVARRSARHGRRVAERAAQLGHLGLQRVHPRAAGPELLDEPLRPHRPAALQREANQQLGGAPRRHRGRHPVAADVDASEHRDGQHGAHGNGAGLGRPRIAGRCPCCRRGAHPPPMSAPLPPGPADRQRIVSGRANSVPVDDQLLRQILDGDDPAVLVAVALAAADGPLERAAALAADARARRTVAVALAYLAGDPDRALLLARDHLADHPADLLVAHVAALAERNLS
jgi:hypothetical protein